MKRDSMIFYRSFFEAIKELPDENKLQVYDAIFDFGLNFKQPKLTGLSKTIFTLILPQLEANIKRFNNGMKPKNKQIESKTEAKQKQNRSKVKANVNVNDNVNNNVNVNNNKNNNKNIPSFEEFSIYALLKEPLLNHSALKLKYDSWIENNWTDLKGQKITNWKSKILNTIPFMQKDQPKIERYEWKIGHTLFDGTKKQLDEDIKSYGKENVFNIRKL